MASRASVRVPPGLAAKIKKVGDEAAARDMLRRGLRVESAAKRNLASTPRRIDTGRLRASINTHLVRYRSSYGARVGSNLQYALYVHEGTGIYGPRHSPIRPRRGKFLRFVPKGKREAVYARSVKGMRPNPFLRDALPAAQG